MESSGRRYVLALSQVRKCGGKWSAWIAYTWCTLNDFTNMGARSIL